MTTIAAPWVQLDNRKRSEGVRWHLPREHAPDHARCGADLMRATPLTPEGAAVGRACVKCERLSVGRGMWR